MNSSKKTSRSRNNENQQKKEFRSKTTCLPSIAPALKKRQKILDVTINPITHHISSTTENKNTSFPNSTLTQLAVLSGATVETEKAIFTVEEANRNNKKTKRTFLNNDNDGSSLNLPPFDNNFLLSQTGEKKTGGDHKARQVEKGVTALLPVCDLRSESGHSYSYSLQGNGPSSFSRRDSGSRQTCQPTALNHKTASSIKTRTVSNSRKIKHLSAKPVPKKKRKAKCSKVLKSKARKSKSKSKRESSQITLEELDPIVQISLETSVLGNPKIIRSKSEATLDKTKRKQRFCYCIARSNLTMPYIGYTVDLNSRIRKHRREIKGGAWRTAKMQGDIQYVAYVTPFLCQRDALMFEWSWNCGRRTCPSFLKSATALQVPHLDVIVPAKSHSMDRADASESSLLSSFASETTKQIDDGSLIHNPSDTKIKSLYLPLKKLVLRLLELLRCEKWTQNAIPSQHPWRVQRTPMFHVHWFLDPRNYGIDLLQSLVAFPVTHHIHL